MSDNTIGNRIKNLRTAKKMTLEDVARAVGVGRSTVLKWETGKITSMRGDKISALADVLGVSPHELMGWEGEKFIHAPMMSEENVSFPVVGDIAAGFDHVALDDWDGDVVELPASYLKTRPREDFFVLRVRGESMYPMYLDGDLVLILKQDTVDYSGQIAAVIYDDELATLKRVEQSPKGDVRLVAVNPNVPPIKIEGERLDHCRIMGVPRIVIREVE